MRDRIKCLKCEKFFYRNNKSVVCHTCIQKDSKEYYTKKIAELEEKLSLTEKALELACERVKYFEEMQDKEMGFYDFFGYDSDYDLQAIIEQYKEQAKEKVKGE